MQLQHRRKIEKIAMKTVKNKMRIKTIIKMLIIILETIKTNNNEISKINNLESNDKIHNKIVNHNNLKIIEEKVQNQILIIVQKVILILNQILIKTLKMIQIVRMINLQKILSLILKRNLIQMSLKANLQQAANENLRNLLPNKHKNPQRNY
jgi:hypothetical protein